MALVSGVVAWSHLILGGSASIDPSAPWALVHSVLSDGRLNQWPTQQMTGCPHMGHGIMRGTACAAGEMNAMDEQDVCEVGQTAPITVAGRTVGNPLGAITEYLKKHPGTVTHYDFIAGTSGEVTAELIRATRMPWMASRISGREETWFIEHARSAPWGLVAPDAVLQDADAARAGGLYDAASALWDHFWSERPKGIATAKISKVLYLMRPTLFPILDRRLSSFYAAAAKVVARDIASLRPEFAACKRMTWEAVRRDLLSNQAALRELRDALGDIDCVLASEASTKISDLRFLDMLAWAAES